MDAFSLHVGEKDARIGKDAAAVPRRLDSHTVALCNDLERVHVRDARFEDIVRLRRFELERLDKCSLLVEHRDRYVGIHPHPLRFAEMKADFALSRRRRILDEMASSAAEERFRLHLLRTRCGLQHRRFDRSLFERTGCRIGRIVLRQFGKREVRLFLRDLHIYDSCDICYSDTRHAVKFHNIGSICQHLDILELDATEIVVRDSVVEYHRCGGATPAIDNAVAHLDAES